MPWGPERSRPQPRWRQTRARRQRRAPPGGGGRAHPGGPGGRDEQLAGTGTWRGGALLGVGRSWERKKGDNDGHGGVCWPVLPPLFGSPAALPRLFSCIGPVPMLVHPVPEGTPGRVPLWRHLQMCGHGRPQGCGAADLLTDLRHRSRAVPRGSMPPVRASLPSAKGARQESENRRGAAKPRPVKLSAAPARRSQRPGQWRFLNSGPGPSARRCPVCPQPREPGPPGGLTAPHGARNLRPRDTAGAAAGWALGRLP